ncbi:MAG: glycosyltransferase family 39 protein [Patescibacteria group bacterium]
MEKISKYKVNKVSVFLKRVTSSRQLPLYLLFIIGGVLRFTNLNWDSYFAFHPDERNISWAITRIRFFDRLNPQFFAYGGLPIYLYRALGESVVYFTHDATWLADWGKIAVIGRTVSAILSSISILLLYRVGKLYFSPTVGLLAAFLLAVSPWAIREAHFATTETMLVFFLLLLLLLSHRLITAGSLATASILGLIQGLALAAKTTSLLFAVIPLAALTLASFHKTSRRLISVFIFLVVAGATFLLFSPYTILDFAKFQQSMRYETGVTIGRFTVPYTLQFLGTTPYLYQLTTMLWQAGVVAPLGAIGILFILINVCGEACRSQRWPWPWHKRLYKQLAVWTLAIARPRHADLSAPIIFLIFPLLYFAWSGSWFAKFARYNIPFLPFLTLSAAWLMVNLTGKLKFVNLLICFLAIWWGLANWSIYLQPQTRLAASRWIYQHIPPGSFIFTEHWNDGLPVGFRGETLPGYPRELLLAYDPDTPEKTRLLAQNLSHGSFVIFSTRRIWGTMPRLTSKYPATSRFYQKFLAGELGYRLVARFTAYPKFLGVTIPDDSAEETIQVFDHPTVLIFQNTEKFTLEEIMARLKK